MNSEEDPPTENDISTDYGPLLLIAESIFEMNEALIKSTIGENLLSKTHLQRFHVAKPVSAAARHQEPLSGEYKDGDKVVKKS